MCHHISNLSERFYLFWKNSFVLNREWPLEVVGYYCNLHLKEGFTVMFL